MGGYWSSQTQQEQVVRKYGWRRDTPSEKDIYHNFAIARSQDTIKSVDLRDRFPAVYDQGELGSCTANGIAAVYEFDEMKENEEKVFTPSRLFIYYNERKANGTIDQDSGASIRDAVMEISKVGVCPETLWTYDIIKYTDCPPQECYDDATKHKCIQYKRVQQTAKQIKQCLIEGFPIVFGIEVYASFETDDVKKTGVIPVPQQEEKYLGGHCIVLCGYDDDKKVFIFRNSWGTAWGDNGYGYLPYGYVLDSKLASDFWTVRQVQDDETDPNLN
ncbi:peptidase C1a [Fadolivirus algeromassiliense]|jgi:C1A family cysteine protease|uniref:Peptidase C1a n=1 Tax=Fadolivirus FV1/VV64 TaxID=3070911 RepID=A0A7D3UUZ7_9VIRU|nr:peptidase C1a [Fadolivirus algeromassiliense]QKF93594.1 peptidase C1a [Fadolivirus FV1/VV64]